jgi:hypothetical protein
MKCEQIREELFETAPGAPNESVKEHMERCPECAQVWASLSATMAVLDEWKVPEPSPFFDTRMQARLAEVKAEEAQRAQGFFSWLRKPALGMPLWRPLSVAALAGVIIFGLNQTNTPVENTNVATKTASTPGTAVYDLQALENNEDAISQLELLDDLGVEDNGSFENLI